ncbi:MAG: hypothetical protein AAFR51_07585 [Pseudomonadota bacterium]
MTSLEDATFIIVLGMHRSGTSALTRVLNILGAALPEKLLGANHSNVTGHWEPAEIVQLNDQFLNTIGSRWDDWSKIDWGKISESDTEEFKRNLKSTLHRLYTGDSLFLLKDPRICRLIPVYREVFSELKVKTKFVIITRNPTEVSKSLFNRDRMIESQAKMLWLRHSVACVTETSSDDRVFTSYSKIVSNWRGELEKISEELQLDLPNSLDESETEVQKFISKKYRHHNFDEINLADDVISNGWISDCYAAILKLSDGRSVPSSLKRIAKIEADLDQYTDFIRAMLLDLQNANEAEKSLQRNIIHELEVKLSEKEQSLNDTTRVAGELVVELDAVRARKRVVEEELDSFRRDAESLRKDRESVRADRDSLSDERDAIRKERDSIREELDQVRRERKAVEEPETEATTLLDT